VNRYCRGAGGVQHANRGILRRVVQQRPLRVARPYTPVGAFVEVHVRSARPTDLDAAVRLMAAADVDPGARHKDVDFLRNLLYVPSATLVVAEAGRQVVGVGVLSIRPSVRSGPFVGVIDELGLAAGELDAAERRHAGDTIVEHLATSARHKGCTRVEVSEPLASAEPSRWKRLGFASRGRTLGRQIG
jgi:predicted N-acetyltransferase YhbS